MANEDQTPPQLGGTTAETTAPTTEQTPTEQTPTVTSQPTPAQQPTLVQENTQPAAAEASVTPVTQTSYYYYNPGSGIPIPIMSDELVNGKPWMAVYYQRGTGGNDTALSNPDYNPNVPNPVEKPTATDASGFLLKVTAGATPDQYYQVPTGQRPPWETGGVQSGRNLNYDPDWFATHGPTVYNGWLYRSPTEAWEIAPAYQQGTHNMRGEDIGSPFYQQAARDAINNQYTPQYNQYGTEILQPGMIPIPGKTYDFGAGTAVYGLTGDVKALTSGGMTYNPATWSPTVASDRDTAAKIADLVGRTGGTIDPNLLATAKAQGYTGTQLSNGQYVSYPGTSGNPTFTDTATGNIVYQGEPRYLGWNGEAFTAQQKFNEFAGNLQPGESAASLARVQTVNATGAIGGADYARISAAPPQISGVAVPGVSGAYFTGSIMRAPTYGSGGGFDAGMGIAAPFKSTSPGALSPELAAAGATKLPFLSVPGVTVTTAPADLGAFGKTFPNTAAAVGFFLPGTTTITKTNADGTPTTTTRESESGFDKTQSGVSNWAYNAAATPFGLTSEEARRGLAIQAEASLQTAMAAPTIQNIETAIGSNVLKAVFDKPVEAGVNVGIGLATAGGSEALSAGYAAGRAGLAVRAIESGGAARTALQSADFAAANGGKVLAGLYAGSVGYRATEGGTNLNPVSVAVKGSVIGATETAPMIAGYGLGTEAIQAAKISNIGFKSALQEGATTGRFDYYVKQPVTAPIENAKIDYAAFKQESGGTAGVTDYLANKAGEAAFKVRVAAAETQGRIAEAADTVGMKITEARVLAQPQLEVATNNLPFRARVAVAETQGRVAEFVDNVPAKVTKAAGDALFETNMAAAKVEDAALQGYAYVGGRANVEYLNYKMSQVPFRAQVAAAETQGRFAEFAENRQYSPYKVVRPVETIQRLNEQSLLGSSAESIKPTTSAAPASGAATEGGTASTFERIASREVGGTKTYGLKQEPSLKAQGVTEATSTTGGEASTKIGTRTDFRPSAGQEQGFKQASGQVSIMSEQLAPVEGMPVGQVAAPAGQTTAFAFVAPLSAQFLSAPTVEESLKTNVGQTQKQANEQAFVTTFSGRTAESYSTPVQSGKSEVKFTGFVPGESGTSTFLGSTSKISSDQGVSQMSATDLTQLSGTTSTQAPGQAYDSMYLQSSRLTEPGVGPFVTPAKLPVIPPLFPGSLGGGVPGGSKRGRKGKKFRETFSLDVRTTYSGAENQPSITPVFEISGGSRKGPSKVITNFLTQTPGKKMRTKSIKSSKNKRSK